MEILFENSDLAVIVKPVGIDSEKELPEKLCETLGGDFFTVHRLDMNVGGVMVYARNKKSAADLSRAITEGKMIKEYLALVHGVPDEKGAFEDLLFKDSSKNKVFVVKRERKGVKRARLEYTRLIASDTSLVRIKLDTGRSHQIRVQFASRGFPLVGDRKYGAKDKATAPMLYSTRLTFPYKSDTLTFESIPEWVKTEDI
ncbi:MAG: RNA pseudouridine synthase [Clostridia bacterium]|nr:RNA pseudouridine synthase [Clostridia bacterium]